MTGNELRGLRRLEETDIAGEAKREKAQPRTPDDAPTLDAKLAFLRQPAHYPETARRVEAVETHMSWVFLTERFAYKLKKPVCYEAMDFRILEARRYFCEEEVRLNRRLAADVYLGVVKLALDARGHLHLGGRGQAVDWLVKMRRLAADRMLDQAIRIGTASAQSMRQIAACMATFYSACESFAIDPAAYRQRLLSTLDASRLELSMPAYALDTAQIERLCAVLCAFLRDAASLFDARTHAGKIVEGHGDLRPEHVCLEDGIQIIDCLEFSRDLRMVDPVDEIGFLAMECERLGAPELAIALLRDYAELSGDDAPPELEHFYQSYRACIRARLAIRHLLEEKFRYSPEWHNRANSYLELAAVHAAQL